MVDPIAQDLAEQILESVDVDSIDQADLAALVGETLGSICKDIFTILELHNVELYADEAFSTIVDGSLIPEEDRPRDDVSPDFDDDIDDMFFELDSEE